MRQGFRFDLWNSKSNPLSEPQPPPTHTKRLTFFSPLHEKILPVIPPSKPSQILLIFVMAILAATPAFAASKTKADEEAGAVLFRDKGCAYCHGAGGTGGKKGPDLSGIRTDKLWPPEKITNQILNGGQKMPPFSDSLTDVEIAHLVAYLRAKQRPVPPPAQTPPPPPGN
jgi:mono/diheme cytochrome c family protein